MSCKLNISGVGCSLLFAVVGLAFATSVVRADDKSDRERKIRVALAIAEAEGKETGTVAAPTIAPAPRAVVPKDYALGRKESLLDRSPLVVYVACDGPKVDGAITCFVPATTFGEVTGPAVVVGYPSGDRMLIEKTLPNPAPVAEIKRAVENAAKKIDPAAKSMPANPPAANYRISVDGCVCGDGCQCKAGDCPAKCPVVATPAATVATLATQPACREVYFYGADGRLYRQTVCPLKK